jgi:flagellar biosynthesis protein FliR
MSPLEGYLVGRFTIFTLVLTRTGGMVVTAPLFAMLTLPRQVRAFLAVAMALVITPVYLNTPLPTVTDLGAYGHLLVNEALIGLLLGLGLSVLFSGIQVAGQIVAQMSGMSLADVFNPGFDDNVPVFTQLFHFLTLAVFVGVGGHRILTQALLDTFTWAPPGHAILGDAFVETLTEIMSQSFVLGIRAAAPLLVALLLSTLVLGLVSRTVPQINVIVVGFGLNSFLTLAMMMISLGAVAWTFQQPSIDTLNHILASLPHGSNS